MNSNATLVLEQGTYYFNSLMVNDWAVVEVPVDGDATVHVRDSLTFRGTVFEPSAWDQDDPGLHGNLRFIFLGENTVHIGNKPFVGTVIAPKARVILNSTNGQGPAGYSEMSGHHGSFYADSIEVHQNTQIWYFPYPPWTDHPGRTWGN